MDAIEKRRRKSGIYPSDPMQEATIIEMFELLGHSRSLLVLPAALDPGGIHLGIVKYVVIPPLYCTQAYYL